jgi:hypothetical protein
VLLGWTLAYPAETAVLRALNDCFPDSPPHLFSLQLLLTPLQLLLSTARTPRVAAFSCRRHPHCLAVLLDWALAPPAEKAVLRVADRAAHLHATVVVSSMTMRFFLAPQILQAYWLLSSLVPLQLRMTPVRLASLLHPIRLSSACEDDKISTTKSI